MDQDIVEKLKSYGLSAAALAWVESIEKDLRQSCVNHQFRTIDETEKDD